jgi:predicted nucleic-acid-binding protein
LKAIDTNVVLRLITGDDERQASSAVTYLEAQPVLVTLSVAMEVEWVLRGAYRWSRSEIANALTAFAALDHVEFEERTGIGWAIERMRDGADFADMIHAVSASSTDAFATFDRKLATCAGPDAPVQIETLT